MKSNFNNWCKEMGVSTLYDYSNPKNIEFAKRLSDAKFQLWVNDREKKLKQQQIQYIVNE